MKTVLYCIDKVQKSTAYTWLDCCCSTQHKLYSLLLPPAMGARFYNCIDKIIKNLKSKSSTGYDNISNKLIKHARAILVKPLTLLTNQIIHTGVFPRQLKIARVKSLFKKRGPVKFPEL